MERDIETAVLFADVSGSTKLYETAGDKVALAAIGQCIDIFREKTLDEGGRVIKTIGDEVMADFPTANAAASAAIEMQIAVDELMPIGNTKLGIRIGFQFGPVLERDGDLFGDTVNLAARLSGLAVKGQVMTSRETVDRLNNIMRTQCRPLHTLQVKGKAEEVALCELMWRVSDEATTLLDHAWRRASGRIAWPRQGFRSGTGRTHGLPNSRQDRTSRRQVFSGRP